MTTSFINEEDAQREKVKVQLTGNPIRAWANTLDALGQVMQGPTRLLENVTALKTPHLRLIKLDQI